MVSPLGEITRWIESGERLKIMYKMRLIVITAIQSDIHPCNLLLIRYSAYHLLKAPNAAKRLWRQPNFAAKHLNEPSLAKTDLTDYILHG